MPLNLVHLKRTIGPAIAIDRSSPLGNPFDMRRDEALRDAVCNGFKRYLWLVAEKGYLPQTAAWKVAKESCLTIAPAWQQPSREAFLLELKRIVWLDDGAIGCWCSPKRCHGDVLLKYREWKRSQALVQR